MADYHKHCLIGSDCCFQPSEFNSGITIDNYLLKYKYDAIDDYEMILFHGTYDYNIKLILDDGFKPELCKDPSFGRGLYMTPCIRLAKTFCGGNGGVFVCKVKLGKAKLFNEFDVNNVREDQHCNILNNGYEYVIFDTERVLPIKIIYL